MFSGKTSRRPLTSSRTQQKLFVGTIIGFPHLGFEGTNPGQIEQNLCQAVKEMIASEFLVLETEFAAVVCFDAGALSVADLPQ
jgi:hypothetical protein